MIRRAGLGFAAFGIMVNLAVLPALAAAPADVAAAVSPQIVQVVSGGNWEDGGKKGYYRAVLVAPADASSGAQIYVQWMTAADASGGLPTISMAAPIKEVTDLKVVDAVLSMEYEKPNEFILYVEPSDPSKAAQQSLTVTATQPGKYTVSKGPLPE